MGQSSPQAGTEPGSDHSTLSIMCALLPRSPPAPGVPFGSCPRVRVRVRVREQTHVGSGEAGGGRRPRGWPRPRVELASDWLPVARPSPVGEACNCASKGAARGVLRYFCQLLAASASSCGPCTYSAGMSQV